MSEGITQIEFSARVGLSRMQVSNLVKEGLPTKNKKGKLEVLWPEGMHWYIKRKVDESLRKRAPAKLANFEVERARKVAAEARLAEIELDKAQGRLMEVDVAERMMLEAFQRVRAKLISMPSTYAPEMLHLKTVPESLEMLDKMVQEVMAELENADDVPVGEEEEEGGSDINAEPEDDEQQ